MPAFVPDSSAAWWRLLIVLAIASVANVGVFSVVIVLPAVQAEFGGTRGAASLAYSFTMLGFGIGGVLMGRLTDRVGIIPAMATGILSLLVGYLAAGVSKALWQFNLAHVLIGLGASAAFVPLMAEVSNWFIRRRGIAVGIAGSGFYLAGALWTAPIQWGVANFGWPTTHIVIGISCSLATSLLVLLLRLSVTKSSPHLRDPEVVPRIGLNLSPNSLIAVLSIASFCCCMAMAIPQVHIVAYCGDLGYGVVRGAEMLSLMLAFGAVSRIGFGLIADRLGGLAALLIGSVAQALALVMYLFADGLTPLYVISALFGLFNGGIISTYTIIVRETMPARDAATRAGIVTMVSLLGMSLGGWVSGVIFDATSSYSIAFLNGIGWNALNVAIVMLLLARSRRRVAVS